VRAPNLGSFSGIGPYNGSMQPTSHMDSFEMQPRGYRPETYAKAPKAFMERDEDEVYAPPRQSSDGCVLS
jgi:hypothetical protein